MARMKKAVKVRRLLRRDAVAVRVKVRFRPMRAVFLIGLTVYAIVALHEVGTAVLLLGSLDVELI